MVSSTRLRYVASKDLELMLMWVEHLSFKIEIKGNPIKDGKRWYLFFNLPDDENPTFSKFKSVVLD